MNEQRVPARVVPPGRIIQREIDIRNWSQRDLAMVINRPVQVVNEIVNGSKQITPDTAIELGAAFGTSAELWMNMETSYRLWLARQVKKDEEIVRRSKIYSLAPIKELQKRGWIEFSTLDGLEREICRFLGISSLEESVQCIASFRRSIKKQIDEMSCIAWLKRVEYLAKRKTTETYCQDKLKNCIPKLVALSEHPEHLLKVPAYLAEVGVSLVFVEHLPKTYIDGAALFIDSTPVIAISLRYNRLDFFWFTLCHELAHILYGNGQTFVDEEVYVNEEDSGGEIISDEEKIADEKARNWLLDPEAYEKFVNKTTPYFSQEAILDFARQQNRHPSIIVGRLKHENRIPQQNFNKLNVKATNFLKYDR